jgi:hypothetical protein
MCIVNVIVALEYHSTWAPVTQVLTRQAVTAVALALIPSFVKNRPLYRIPVINTKITR